MNLSSTLEEWLERASTGAGFLEELEKYPISKSEGFEKAKENVDNYIVHHPQALSFFFRRTYKIHYKREKSKWALRRAFDNLCSDGIWAWAGPT